MEQCICNGSLDVVIPIGGKQFMQTDTHVYIAATIYRSGKRHKLGFVHSTGIRMHTRKWFGHRGKASKEQRITFL